MTKNTKDIVRVVYDFLVETYNDLDYKIISDKYGHTFTRGFKTGIEFILLMISQAMNYGDKNE